MGPFRRHSASAPCLMAQSRSATSSSGCKIDGKRFRNTSVSTGVHPVRKVPAAQLGSKEKLGSLSSARDVVAPGADAPRVQDSVPSRVPPAFISRPLSYPTRSHVPPGSCPTLTCARVSLMQSLGHPLPAKLAVLTAPSDAEGCTDFFQVFRGQEASFMRKIGASFRKPSRQKPAIII